MSASVLPRFSPSSAWRACVRGLAVAMGVAVGSGGCGGIGITADDSDFSASPAAAGGSDGVGSTSAGDSGSEGDAGVTLSASASASPGAEVEASTYVSALCGSTRSCDPDKLTSNGCGDDDDDADGGAGDDDAGGSSNDASATQATACRVSPALPTKPSTLTASACVAAGAGDDGAACTGGDDCRAGFECVGAPGVCRRYCCSGTCGDAKTFCDVQPASGTSAMTVPVCIPVTPCKLLVAGSCASGSTCSIVADDGTTSCVAVGTASEDVACDTTHCAAEEICVGKSGARQCEKLCHVDGTDCSAGKTCTGNATLFADATLGVCTDSP